MPTGSLARRRIDSLAAEAPLAVELARLASLAVRVDAGLLRRLRIALLPAADPGVESDLWFSALVESRSGTGFQMAPEVLRELRADLGRDRTRVADVRRITAEAHARAAPAIRLEEQLNGILLEEGEAALPEIEACVRPALRTLAGGGDAARDVARWAVRAAMRLDPGVLSAPTVQTLLLAAAWHVGLRNAGVVQSDGAQVGVLRWALPSLEALPLCRIAATFVEGGMRFELGPPSGEAIEAPMTEPVLVELEWTLGTDTQRRTAEATPGVLVSLGGDPDIVLLTTLLGKRYLITRHRPPITERVERAPEQVESKRSASFEAIAPHGPIRSGKDQWDVFLSYRSGDRSWALQLYDRLSSLNYRVFMDQFVLVAGGNLVTQLEEHLGSSASAVLIWSSRSEDSEWCKHEYNALATMQAQKRDFRFVVVRIGEAELPMFARTQLWIDFQDYQDGPSGTGLLRLLYGLQGKPLPGEAVHIAAAHDDAVGQATARIAAARRNGDADMLIQLAKTDAPEWIATPTLSAKVAEALIALNRPQDALPLLDQLTERFPRSIRVSQLKGLALVRTGNWRAARQVLGELYELGERGPETMGLYARTWRAGHAETGDVLLLRRARDLYAEAFKLAPTDIYIGINAAATSVLLGELDTAEALAADVEELAGSLGRKGDYWGTVTAAEAQLIRRRFTEAAALYAAAVRDDPEARGSHESTRAQARLLMDKLSPSVAERAAVEAAFGSDIEGEIAGDTAAIESPGAPVDRVAQSLNDRGDAKGQGGDSQGAIADYTAVIELAGAPVDQVAHALYNRGVAKSEVDDAEGALADFTATIELPGAPVDLVTSARYNRGVTRDHIGDSEGAVGDYTAVIELPGAPVDLVAHAIYSRGVTKSKAGDNEGAVDDYTAVINLPGAPSDLVKQAIYNRGLANVFGSDSQGGPAN